MLIRMQDRTEIVNFDHVVCFKAENNGTVRILIKDGVYTAGEYGTKEKAIKVLDMIQSSYINQNKISQTYMENIGVLESGYVGCEVFQMPTDEEVDEPTVQDIIDDVMKM